MEGSQTLTLFWCRALPAWYARLQMRAPPPYHHLINTTNLKLYPSIYQGGLSGLNQSFLVSASMFVGFRLAERLVPKLRTIPRPPGIVVTSTLDKPPLRHSFSSTSFKMTLAVS